MSHTKAWEVGFPLGVKQTAVFHDGYWVRYDTTLDIVTNTTVVYMVFLYWTTSYQRHLRRGQVTQRHKKNQTENIGSLNSSFTALTRQDVSSHYSVGRERLASAGSLDISSPFSICGHQCSFNYKTFSIIQCLWEVSSDTLCSLVTSLLAALFQKLSFLREATSFLSRRV